MGKTIEAEVKSKIKRGGEMGMRTQDIKKATRAWRIMGYIDEVKRLCEELETNDEALVTRLLILDLLRIKNLKKFKGVEVNGEKKQ